MAVESPPPLATCHDDEMITAHLRLSCSNLSHEFCWMAYRLSDSGPEQTSTVKRRVREAEVPDSDEAEQTPS